MASTKKSTVLQQSSVYRFIVSGINNVINNKDRIDALNVFPVPDGDTGSNMASTLKYALAELEKAPLKTLHSGEMLKIFARGMLFGARGNSGVILSQIFKGFSVALENKERVEAFDLVKAFNSAREFAYKAVMKAVEGTILTVIKDVADALSTNVTFKSSYEDIFRLVVDVAQESVNNTPNLLPVLKEVGVVDSGGEGLLQFFKGVLAAQKGRPVELLSSIENRATNFSLITKKEAFEGEFGYCTEFILEISKPKNFNKAKFEQTISKMGDSLVSVMDDFYLKVHIHTKKPAEILNFAMKRGELIKLKSENMQVQTNRNKASQLDGKTTPLPKFSEKSEQVVTSVKKRQPTSSDIDVVAVCSGAGITEQYREFGTAVIVEGGQTSNPSAVDIVNAVKTTTSSKIILLPNNSNVILACQQASKMFTDKKIIIVPTKNMLQGLSALYSFDPDESLEENRKEMIEAIEDVETGSVTICTRDTKIKKVQVTKGEYVAIVNGEIIGSYVRKMEAGINVLKRLIKKDSEIVTIYYGLEATDIDAKAIQDYVENNYESIEVEIKNGGQPIYNFLFSVE